VTLGQDPRHELMGLFAASLRDLGRRVCDGYGASFAQLAGCTDGSAVALALRLGSWPCFADTSRYHEIQVPFLKRAQIAAADLARARVIRPEDLSGLTMFADNLVPHVLRVDGVLEYAPSLLERIEREALIPAGSAEELEIRACAVHAVELIGQAIRRGGAAVTAMQLDYVLWNRGQAPAYKARPRHRTRTVFY
jgi:hypothetical protein